MSIFDLSNKYIVVFGGAGYLGSACVKAMLEMGAKVVVADSFPDYTRKNVMEFESNPGCMLFKCDMGDTNQIRGAYDKCIERFGALNAMVNLATCGAANSIDKMTDDEWNLYNGRQYCGGWRLDSLVISN